MFLHYKWSQQYDPYILKFRKQKCFLNYQIMIHVIHCSFNKMNGVALYLKTH